MHDAMKEYLVLSKSDYCGSTSIKKSTFSQTALTSGDCRFIDVTLGDACLQNATFNQNKNLVLETSPTNEEIDADLSSEIRKKLWGKLKRGDRTHHYPCFKQEAKDDVLNFWKAEKCLNPA